MDRPVIGITMASLTALDGVAPPQPESSVVGTRYVASLTAAGAVPWPIPVVADAGFLRSVYERLDGLLLPGGADIRSFRYGAEPHPTLDRGDAERDEAEQVLARWAWGDGTPLLGICRGMQVMNVALGGTLVQDLAAGRPFSLKHDYFPLTDHPRDRMVHLVQARPGTRTCTIIGKEALAVNSIHHQAVERVGEGLIVSAEATDGVVEAVEAPDHPFFLGVQWHPEELPRHRVMRRVFEALVDASRQGRESLDVVTLPAAS